MGEISQFWIEFVNRDITPTSITTLIGLVFIGVIFNLRSIFNFFSESYGRRKFIKASLMIPFVEKDTKFLLKEELNRLLFKKATGINADYILRHKLVDVIEQSLGGIQISRLKKIKGYIKIKEGEFKIDISSIDKGIYGINRLLLVVSIIYSLYFFILFEKAMMFITISYVTTSITLFTAVGSLLFARLLWRQIDAYSEAKKLEPIIKTYEKEKNSKPF